MPDINPEVTQTGEPIESNQEQSQQVSLETSTNTSQQPQTQAQQQEQQVQQAIQNKLKKLKLKVDGEEVEEELPFEIEDKPEVVEYVKKQLQLAKVAQKRMAHSSALEKEINAFLEALRENPEEVLSDANIGVDVEKFVQQYMERKIENSKKTPEQLEQEKIHQQLKELQEENKRKDELIKQKELENLQKQMFEEYNTSIDKALKEANKQSNQYIKGKIADYMLTGLNNNIDIKPQDALKQSLEDAKDDLKQILSLFSDSELEELVGVRFKKKAPTKQVPTPATLMKTTDTGGKPVDVKQSEKQSLKEFDLFKKIPGL